VGIPQTKTSQHRLKQFITRALACVACGLSIISHAALAQNSERTCTRVERNPNGLEIWMWTEPVDDPATTPPRGDAVPADPLKTAPPMPGDRQNVVGADLDAEVRPNPVRIQGPSRCQSQPAATTATVPAKKSPEDDADRRLHADPESTGAETPCQAEAGGDAKQPSEAPPDEQVEAAAGPQAPSREENATNQPTGPPPPGASRPTAKPSDHREQLAGPALLIPQFVPLSTFLAGLTFYLILLPVVMFLILCRCAKRYGLILQVDLANTPRSGHDLPGETPVLRLRNLDAANEDHFDKSSALAMAGEACGEREQGAKKRGRIEGQTLFEQVFDDNTGLRRQIAGIRAGAA